MKTLYLLTILLSIKIKSVIMLLVKKGGILVTKVVVRNGKVDQALKDFKQKVVKNGLLKEIREKEHYSKPGVKKRLAKQEAIKNSMKKDKRNN